MKTLSLHLILSQWTMQDGVRRCVTLSGESIRSHSGDDLEIWYDLLGEHDLPPPHVLDGFVAGVIFLAMRLGAPLRIHGPVSRSLCVNLMEFQSAWALWCPERYRVVELLPDEVVDLPVTVPGGGHRAIAAYSGGVDGTATAIRHASQLLGNGSYRLTDLLLVHGFDVPLDAGSAFDALVARTRPFVDSLGLDLRLVRTNIRGVLDQRWEDSFLTQLVGALFNYAHSHRYCLVGSGATYRDTHVAWGSTAMTDHLLSGDLMQVVLDGSALNRTEKCALIAGHPAALRSLKVCWEGKDYATNCGHCEKCLRTKMNLLAAGADPHECFGDSLDTAAVGRLRPRNQPQLAELRSILECAELNGVKAPWVRTLNRRVSLFTLRAHASRLARLFVPKTHPSTDRGS